jgi:hypothetical protein
VRNESEHEGGRWTHSKGGLVRRVVWEEGRTHDSINESFQITCDTFKLYVREVEA